MPVQITIIGTGQIGSSIGLALGDHKDLFFRVGHDKEARVSRQAKDMGALDRVEVNLPHSVADSAIVLLALPIDQIHDTLQAIASELKDDAIIMDTAPVKAGVLQWVREILPPNSHYIGLVPAINPAYLETHNSGVEAAHPDLFTKGLFAIVASPNVPAEAIKLAMDFCHLLGAQHMFIDPTELDSMMTATHILPQLLSAALINSTVDQPGWADSRKLAGRPYALVASALAQTEEINALSRQAITAGEHLQRWLEALIDYLYGLRDELSDKDVDKLRADLARAASGHEKWLTERMTGNWTGVASFSNMVLPTAGQEFRRMFTFGGGRKPKSKNRRNQR